MKSTKFQAPNNKQITMSKIPSSKQNSFCLSKIGNWDLFGIWNLELGILTADTILYGR
jgi:hypothetical protein